jgi:hypothetical protein
VVTTCAGRRRYAGRSRGKRSAGVSHGTTPQGVPREAALPRVKTVKMRGDSVAAGRSAGRSLGKSNTSRVDDERDRQARPDSPAGLLPLTFALSSTFWVISRETAGCCGHGRCPHGALPRCGGREDPSSGGVSVNTGGAGPRRCSSLHRLSDWHRGCQPDAVVLTSRGRRSANPSRGGDAKRSRFLQSGCRAQAGDGRDHNREIPWRASSLAALMFCGGGGAAVSAPSLPAADAGRRERSFADGAGGTLGTACEGFYGRPASVPPRTTPSTFFVRPQPGRQLPGPTRRPCGRAVPGGQPEHRLGANDVVGTGVDMWTAFSAAVSAMVGNSSRWIPPSTAFSSPAPGSDRRRHHSAGVESYALPAGRFVFNSRYSLNRHQHSVGRTGPMRHFR